MITIGITGGIGCGKSQVCGYLKDKYKAAVFTADTIAHDVILPGGLAYGAYLDLFGPEYLLADGTFNRKKIGDRAFRDPKILQTMNGIIHPAVHEAIVSGVRKEKEIGTKLCVVEAALLIEADYRDFCMEYWYVYADRDTRVKRLLASRDLDTEKIESIMARQLDEEIFRRECEFTVDNSGDFSSTAAAIDARIEYLRKKTDTNTDALT